MVKHDAPVPLYIQIKDYIRHNIENGVFGIDQKFPSERQLAAQFGVNRLTVSKAINELAQDGLVYSRVGKGTFVASAKIDQTLHTLTSFTEDMVSCHKTASSRVLYADVKPANEDVAKALSIFPGTEVVVLHRVRMADGQAIALGKSCVIHALCPRIVESHDFSQESLYRVLSEKYHIQMAYAYQTIEAQFPSPDILDTLEADSSTPILYAFFLTQHSQNRQRRLASSEIGQS